MQGETAEDVEREKRHPFLKNNIRMKFLAKNRRTFCETLGLLGCSEEEDRGGALCGGDFLMEGTPAGADAECDKRGGLWEANLETTTSVSKS